jgi:hypothetical protein
VCREKIVSPLLISVYIVYLGYNCVARTHNNVESAGISLVTPAGRSVTSSSKPLSRLSGCPLTPNHPARA